MPTPDVHPESARVQVAREACPLEQRSPLKNQHNMRRTLPSILTALTGLLLALPAFAGNPAGLLQYVPSSAEVVVGVDVDKVRGNPLWDRALSLSNDNGDVQNTLNEIGFDPRTTVSAIVFASSEAGDGAAEHAVVLLETSYPAEQLATALTGDGYEAGTVGAIAYYRKSESTVAFLGEGTLAIGEFALVEPALGVAAGQGSAGASGAVASQVSAVDTSSAIWAAVDLPSGSQGAESARMSIDLTGGFSARVTARMESAELASTTATQLTAQLGTLSSQPEVQGLGLGAVLGSVEASASGADLSLAVSVDSSTWGTLIQTLGALAEEEMR